MGNKDAFVLFIAIFFKYQYYDAQGRVRGHQFFYTFIKEK